ncbi:PREDICTED: tripartite motif-containing protein 60-like [Myotis brandtii]|uniref:tripartite motif-containing protein 60-like n=1 Tax=Myotis brandtii TaxID=109478 RepID=UPI0007044120|nr:PREDICTED: tripartite motif-containing protein 60-like [Myotis brandtii]
MAFAASLAQLQAEASCPICLDYLRDPVTIACGHNFCPSCIHQRWEDMTEIVQQSPTSGSQRKMQEEMPLCGKHREVLIRFCEKSLELLCPQCMGSLDPPDQPLVPIEEAAASQRGVLKRCMGVITEYLKNSVKVYEYQGANILAVKRKMNKWRNKLDYECNDLKYSLEIEYNEFDNDLLVEENNVEEKLIENGRQISYHMFRLSNRLSEIEEKCLQTDEDLLTGIESIHNSYEHRESPDIFSYKLEKEIFTLPPHYLGLHKMINTFQADLTLDPETAHPDLLISRNGKQATYWIPDGILNPQALSSYPAVLSSEGFDAGRHFWVVTIGVAGECSLGVCKESFPINTLISPSTSNGCWTHTFGPFSIPKEIGVFLDYELGEVSFYNLKTCSLLYGITATFRGKLMPYFSIVSSESLTTSIIRV